jgi:hypothetical protein
MKEFLCQMLAHHFICLGILGTKPEIAVERVVLDGAMPRRSQTDVSLLAKARAAPKSRTAIASHGIGSYRRSTAPSFVAMPCPAIVKLDKSDGASENPESYLSMTDDVPGLVGQGLNDQQNFTTKSRFPHGAYMQHSCLEFERIC